MDKGQSLVEVLIALSVFAVGIATIGFLVLDANVASRQGLERTQATLFAQEGLEAVRSIRDADFDSLINAAPGPHGLARVGNVWVFSGTSDTQGTFTREVVLFDMPGVLDDPRDIKMVEVIVTWQFAPVRQNSVTLRSYLTDWDQTHGNAADLSLDLSVTALAGGGKRLERVMIENVGASSITIDRMTLWWVPPDTMHRIRFEGSDVFKKIPPDGEPSGTEINITDITLPSGSGLGELEFRFNGSMSGTDFIIKFIMTDGSARYALVDV